ncbi:MAG TPA: GGDEF domain-containing protein [Burkholderiales bacterium]|nr:GGDEF domain-containing protein [Burkholderiales bacterium]
MAHPHEKTGIGTYFVVIQRRERWLVLALMLLLTVGAVDYLTNYRFNLLLLYLFPLLVVIWFTGPWSGLLLSVVATTSWAYVDFAGRHGGDSTLVWWNWGALQAGFALLVAGSWKLRRALDDAHFQSRRDALTELVNKAGFYQIVGAEMEVCRRYKRSLSIAYIDCDNFKAVNDRFGHHVGDELLRRIAHIMTRKLRASDLPGRLGGDEFAVMLPETSAEACRMVVEMLQQRLLQEMRQHDWPVTFSIGIATFVRIPQTIDDMIRQADKLMYMVKRTDKGAIRQEVFSA